MGSMAMDAKRQYCPGLFNFKQFYVSVRTIYRENERESLGLMTRAEKGIINGAGSQTGIWSGRSRWGDYSGMSADPFQINTFWYTRILCIHIGR